MDGQGCRFLVVGNFYQFFWGKLFILTLEVL